MSGVGAVSLGEAAANAIDIETLTNDVQRLYERLDAKLREINERHHSLEYAYVTESLELESERETVTELRNGVVRAKLFLARKSRR